MPQPLSRRTVLRGLGGVSVALPFLDAMRTRAAVAAAPKRYVQLTSPLGMSPGQWYSGAASAITINDFAAPLRAHTKDLLIVRGLRGWNGASGHHSGMGTIWTGRDEGSGYGVSVDQEIAKLNGNGAKYRSLHFGFFTSTSTGKPGETHTTFAGPNQPINAKNDPKAMFASLFGDGGTAPAPGGGGAMTIDRAHRRKRSVLDLVRDDFKDVQVGLSATDKKRLTTHAEFLRSIEAQLMQLDSGAPPVVAPAADCKGPEASRFGSLDSAKQEQGALLARAQSDLLIMATACDLTRVATLQWAHSVSGIKYSWLEAKMKGIGAMNHHGWTHNPDTGNWNIGLPFFRTIEKWYLEEVGYILDGLKAMNAFENTIVAYATNEPRGQHGDDEQGRDDRVMVIAESSGGYFKTGGRVADFDLNGGYKKPEERHDYHNSILVHLAKAFGSSLNRFGNDYQSAGGPAPGLTA